VAVSFQFGATTAYGQSTAAQRIGPASSAVPFSAQLAGLAPGSTVHYRAVATSDFGTFVGADQVLRTAAAPPPPVSPPGAVAAGHGSVLRVSASGATARVRVTCAGKAGAVCRLVVRLTTLSAGRASHGSRHALLIGRASIVLHAGQTRTVSLALNRAGRHLLGHRRSLRARLTVQQVGVSAVRSAVVTLRRRHR
jgi:hypothetical protein